MTFRTLLRRDGPVLGYGFAFTFGSSVGQTFFISLFIPGIAVAVSMSETRLAAFYGLATVASAMALPWFGRLIDRADIARYGLMTGAALAVGCWLMAAAINPWMVLAAMFVLRLAGQGLMSHVGLTGVARYFDRDRGKALSLTGLGHAAGEGVLPILMVTAIAVLGWRMTYGVAGAVVGLVLVPLATWLILNNPAFRRAKGAEGASGVRQPNPLLRSGAFWAHLPLLLLSPLTVTALIFHQGLIAQSKGLELTVFAAAFAAFALVQIPTSLIVGPVVDRIGSRGPLLLHLAPLAVGAGLLAAFKGAWAVWAFLALMGVTNAAGAILRTAIVAEWVVPARMGEARSFLTALMVLSTAIGPALYGVLMEAGVSVPGLLWLAAASTLAALAPGVIYGLAVRER
ncbi:MAG: MFS transporter [Brevundimonas sp.]